MRCTQIRGLSNEALAFLRDNRRQPPPSVACPTCGHRQRKLPDDHRVWASASAEGMFDDGPELWEYTLADGRVVREVVQDVPWSSGPVIFLCLMDEAGTKFCEWPQEEIDNA